MTAIVTVDGRVSAPKITFSSEPPLPEDEVLARVLFNRSTQNLSAFQVAQLAAAAAELAGGGGAGDPRRSSAAPPASTTSTSSPRRTARPRCAPASTSTSNIYLDVQTDTEGVTRAEIRLDLSRSVTARGSVGSDGNSTIGLFYERDY